MKNGHVRFDVNLIAAGLERGGRQAVGLAGMSQVEPVMSAVRSLKSAREPTAYQLYLNTQVK